VVVTPANPLVAATLPRMAISTHRHGQKPALSGAFASEPPGLTFPRLTRPGLVLLYRGPPKLHKPATT